MFGLIFAASAVLILADGQPLETDLSLNNPTRIIFEDDRPVKFIFNAADDGAPNIAAEIGTGDDVFVSVEKGAVGQSISGFITTESGKTYPVKFSIKNLDTAQVTIASSELRAEAAKAKSASANQTKALASVEWTHTSSYPASLGELVKAMYRGHPPEGFKEAKASRLDHIHNEYLTAVPHKRFEAANIRAVTYVVKGNKDHSVYLPNHLNAFPDYLALSYSGERIDSTNITYVYVVTDKTLGEAQ